jgi:outer membrane biosynthesis protein TonB
MPMKHVLRREQTGIPTAVLPARHIGFRAGSLLLSRRVLVAFDTGRGLVYARASGWERAYLLWTFRNFRSLPQEVLNPRQQELITTLYRTACAKSAHQWDDALIGTVEGVYRPSSLPVRAAADHEVTGICTNEATASFAFIRLPFSGLVPARTALRIGTGALLAVVAVLGWRQSRSQPVLAGWVSAAWTDKAAIAQQTGSESGPKALTEATDQSAPEAAVQPLPPLQIPATQVSATQVPATEISATQVSSRQVPLMRVSGAEKIAVTPIGTVTAPEPENSQLRPSAPAVDRLEAQPALSRRADLPTPTPTLTPAPTHEGPTHQALSPETPAKFSRMQISGPPRRLVYPVCPDTNVRGKVSLHAVVGSDGAVSHVKVLKGDRTLAAAAIKAVRQWRYQPFSGDTRGSERETNITVSFVSSEVVAVSFPDSAISR